MHVVCIKLFGEFSQCNNKNVRYQDPLMSVLQFQNLKIISSTAEGDLKLTKSGKNTFSTIFIIIIHALFL